MEITALYNLILEVTSLFYILFVTNTSLDPAYTLGEGITQGMNTRRCKLLGVILGAADTDQITDQKTWLSLSSQIYT